MLFSRNDQSTDYCVVNQVSTNCFKLPEKLIFRSESVFVIHVHKACKFYYHQLVLTQNVHNKRNDSPEIK